MIKVHLITEEQANRLKEIKYIPDSYFNPIQDIDGNWIISCEEVNQCNINWLKDTELIEYIPYNDIETNEEQ